MLKEIYDDSILFADLIHEIFCRRSQSSGDDGNADGVK